MSEERYEAEKRRAAHRAVDFVDDGMTVGLGTGSTVAHALERLAERIREGLKIRGVPTSKATADRARELEIPLIELDDVDQLDLTIDGADEVDPAHRAIKGGGGALLREKIVATASREVILIVDSRKLVDRLGGFPLPVEVVPFGHSHVAHRLEADGLNPELRRADGAPFTTDNGNLIYDLHLNAVPHPARLEARLNNLPGVVENGLFLHIATRVIVGREDDVEVRGSA